MCQRALGLMICFAMGMLSGCLTKTTRVANSTRPGIRSYSAKGVIQELALDRRSALIRHEAIASYMPAMTMDLSVLDSHELEGFTEGDEISFTLMVNEDAHWITLLRKITASVPSRTDGPSPSNAGSSGANLRPGDRLPDHPFLSETSRTLRFSDFRGQAFAFTFIFSRCPLPDYCPRMSRHFGTARTMLQQAASGPTNWSFISISFDPEFDKPAVLTRYARSYRGEDTNRWLFASASTQELELLQKELDLIVTRRSGSVAHNLRTVVVDPQGRVHQQFDGNEWSARELANSLVEAARKTQ